MWGGSVFDLAIIIQRPVDVNHATIRQPVPIRPLFPRRPYIKKTNCGPPGPPGFFFASFFFLPSWWAARGESTKRLGLDKVYFCALLLKGCIIDQQR